MTELRLFRCDECEKTFPKKHYAFEELRYSFREGTYSTPGGDFCSFGCMTKYLADNLVGGAVLAGKETQDGEEGPDDSPTT